MTTTAAADNLRSPQSRVRRLAASTGLFARDFQSLSLFRIVFGIFLLSDFYLLEQPYFSDFRSDTGLLPLAVLREDFADLRSIVVILQVLEAVGIQTILPVLFPAAALAFAFGYRTRWANAILLTLTSYIGFRNPYVVSGAEVLIRLLLLWGIFLPLNRYWSIDAALDRRPRDRPHPLVPFLALRLQIASLYVFAGLFKLATPAWIDGVALAWSLQDNVFGGRDAGLYLVDHASYLLCVLNYLVIIFQVAFPILIYSPWRNGLTRGIAIATAAAMHVSFLFCLNIGGFPYVCLSMLILLVPDRWVTELLCSRRARLHRIAIFYEPGCAFCQKIALLLGEFLLPPTVSIEPASIDATANDLLTRHRSWVVRGSDGHLYLKWSALTYVLRQNAFFVPLSWLIGWHALQSWFDKLYDLIGLHRRKLRRITTFLLPFRRPAAPGRAAQLICGLLAALALATNLSSVAPLAIDRSIEETPIRFASRAPAWLNAMASDLLVWQNWPLFTPPPHWVREFRVTAYTLGGESFDVIAQQPAPAYRVGTDSRLIFSTNRWLKYFSQLDILSEGDWSAFGRYLCRMAAVKEAAGRIPVVEFSALSRPISGTSDAGMPPNQHRSLDCRQAGN